MNRTSIEWTTFSANPLKYRDAAGRVVWACVHASEGCRYCYSEALAKRYGRGGPFAAQVMKNLAPFLDEAELRHMLTAQRIGGVPVSGSRCFVGDMTDLFGEWVPDDLLNRLFSEVLELRQDVTWQLLTKRADRMKEYLSWRWGGGRIPARNIHVGVSVENQATADERIPLLLQTPAAKRFVSYEPALGEVHFGRYLNLGCANCGNGNPPNEDILDPPLSCGCRYCYICSGRDKDEPCELGEHPAKLDWLIVGGESGPGARPFDVAWARSTIEQCRAAGVPVFVKQLGARPFAAPTVPIPSDRSSLRDHKGGDWSEWPEDLRVREFPR